MRSLTRIFCFNFISVKLHSHKVDLKHHKKVFDRSKLTGHVPFTKDNILEKEQARKAFFRSNSSFCYGFCVNAT